MSEITKAALAFTAAGLLYVGLGIPLLLGRIKPNRWYGCRTSKTMSDERTWYRVNRVTGRDLTGVGIALVITSCSIYFLGRNMQPDYAVAALLTVMIVGVLVMVINSIRAQNRIS